MSGGAQVRSGSRRPRLWELEHKCHCPIVGVCFDLGEIRALVCGLVKFEQRPSDFDIHAIAARECGANTPLAKRLGKELDRKYVLHLAQARACEGEEELYALWRRGVESGEIGGPMWAALSHPACGEALRQRIYGEVHMLQHQVGAGHRVEQQALLRLRRENAALGRELADIQKRFTGFRDERANALQALREQLATSRAEAVRHESAASRLLGELENLRAAVADPRELLRLGSRLKTAEAENRQLKHMAADMEARLALLEADNRRLEGELFRLSGAVASGADGDAIEPVHAAPLKGRTVLCVGGLGKATRHYQGLVEMRGGAFLHHDGGAEENIRRLDAIIAAADAVICQTGCVSHNAYWRVKDQCKRNGKPCAFVGNPSLSSFLRVLEDIAGASPMASAEA